MADNHAGQRQQRQAAYVPRLGPADLLSDEARVYADGVAAAHAAAAADPYLNGQDAERRLHSDG
jgi:hypothetical protein